MEAHHGRGRGAHARYLAAAVALAGLGCDVFDHDAPDHGQVCAGVACGMCDPRVVLLVEDGATSAGIPGVVVSGAPVMYACATATAETQCTTSIGATEERYDVTVSAPGYAARALSVDETLAATPLPAPGSCCPPCAELRLSVALDPA
jgi:hypothetical protein